MTKYFVLISSTLNELLDRSFMLQLLHAAFLRVHLFDSVVFCEFFHHLSKIFEIIEENKNVFLPSVFFFLLHRGKKLFLLEFHLQVAMPLQLESIVDPLFHFGDFIQPRFFFLLVESQLAKNVFVFVALRFNAFQLFCQLI